MSFRLLSFVLLTVLLIGSCKKNPVDPVTDSRISDVSARSFSIAMVDYDTFEITGGEFLSVSGLTVKKVSIGTKSNSTFIELASTTPSYISQGTSYRLVFSLTAKADSSAIIFPVTVRYTYQDNEVSDVDTSVKPYQYPFTSTEIFLTNEFHQFSADMRLQGFDFDQGALYYHPIGPEGLFEYPLSGSAPSRRLVQYGSGDYVAADSGYIFYETGNGILYRYDIQADTTTYILPSFSVSTAKRIGGLATDNGVLYVVYQSGSQPWMVGKFTYDGTPIDSASFQRSPYQLAVRGDTLYTLDYVQRSVARFVWSTKSFIADRPFPCRDPDGIRIHQDNFYFADFFRRTIGVIPFSEFR